ncbi:MAG: glycosyltransferase family 4 protein [Cyanobacteriota bacterium]|nr:glycosyltransferase family 4 protein [Cyanobacteriota bacterium]
MKVLYWTQRFWPHIGGVEVHASRFLPEMVRRGHEFRVITSPGGRDLPPFQEVEGIPVHRFRFEEAFQKKDPGLMAHLRREVGALKQSFQPDLVHLHLTDPSVIFHLMTRHLHPCPTLLSLRVSLEGDLQRPDSLMVRSLTAADWITGNTVSVLGTVHQQLPDTLARSSVILNALDPPASAPPPLPWDPPVLLLLGRLVPEKGCDVALRALPAIVPHHPGLQVIVAGDGPSRPELQAIAQELGLGDRVRFLGWVDPQAVPGLINTATLVVVPSRWMEAFGIVALQAAQQARPVVASRVGGLPEVVLHDETGLLVEREDPEGLARAVLRLLADPELTRRLGEEGRRRAAEQFSWTAHLDDFCKLYGQLAG